MEKMERVDKGPRARKSALKQFYGKSNRSPTVSENDPTQQLFEQALFLRMFSYLFSAVAPTAEFESYYPALS